MFSKNRDMPMVEREESGRRIKNTNQYRPNTLNGKLEGTRVVTQEREEQLDEIHINTTIGTAETAGESNSIRSFIITKRKKPIRFKDMNLRSLDYEFVDYEKQATFFDSMTDLMSMLDRLCKNGEKGIWYREVAILGEEGEHLYVFMLNSKTRTYVGLSRMRGTLFWTTKVHNAYKCKSFTEIINFGLDHIPKNTLDELRIVDLKEAEASYTSRYIFKLAEEEQNKLLDIWERLGDDEAFKKFSSIIETGIADNKSSDIFKREVLKLIGARKYLIDSEDAGSKEFTKNALIGLFCKMIELQAEKQNLLYIEWFIRNKLMTADEVRWITRTKWFNNTCRERHGA